MAAQLPMPSAIILRLDRWFESRRIATETDNEKDRWTAIAVIDALLGVLRHSERLTNEEHRGRLVHGLMRLKHRYAEGDWGLAMELDDLIERHS